jgi:hypothetical protein
MSEWSARPRTMAMAGHRKATLAFCADCATFHKTRYALGGPEICFSQLAAREARVAHLFVAPHVRTIPRTASK